MDKLSPRSTCRECRKAQSRVRAAFYVEGHKVGADRRVRPYRGYVCAGHLQAMRAEGGEFALHLTVDVDRLARKYTACNSLEQLCERRTPTLCTDSAPTHNDRLELRLLADAYDRRQAKRGDERRVQRR